MSKISMERVILMPSADDNAKIVAAAEADPDPKPMTKAQQEDSRTLAGDSGHSGQGCTRKYDHSG